MVLGGIIGYSSAKVGNLLEDSYLKLNGIDPKKAAYYQKLDTEIQDYERDIGALLKKGIDEKNLPEVRKGFIQYFKDIGQTLKLLEDEKVNLN